MSSGQGGSAYGVYGQRFDSTGAKLDGEFQVNTYASSEQEYPAVAMGTDGSFVVGWQSNGQGGSDVFWPDRGSEGT